MTTKTTEEQEIRISGALSAALILVPLPLVVNVPIGTALYLDCLGGPTRTAASLRSVARGLRLHALFSGIGASILLLLLGVGAQNLLRGTFKDPQGVYGLVGLLAVAFVGMTVALVAVARRIDRELDPSWRQSRGPAPSPGTGQLSSGWRIFVAVFAVLFLPLIPYFTIAGASTFIGLVASRRALAAGLAMMRLGLAFGALACVALAGILFLASGQTGPTLASLFSVVALVLSGVLFLLLLLFNVAASELVLSRRERLVSWTIAAVVALGSYQGAAAWRQGRAPWSPVQAAVPATTTPPTTTPPTTTAPTPPTLGNRVAVLESPSTWPVSEWVELRLALPAATRLRDQTATLSSSLVRYSLTFEVDQNPEQLLIVEVERPHDAVLDDLPGEWTHPEPSSRRVADAVVSVTTSVPMLRVYEPFADRVFASVELRTPGGNADAASMLGRVTGRALHRDGDGLDGRRDDTIALCAGGRMRSEHAGGTTEGHWRIAPHGELVVLAAGRAVPHAGAVVADGVVFGAFKYELLPQEAACNR